MKPLVALALGAAVAAGIGVVVWVQRVAPALDDARRRTLVAEEEARDLGRVARDRGHESQVERDRAAELKVRVGELERMLNVGAGPAPALPPGMAPQGTGAPMAGAGGHTSPMGTVRQPPAPTLGEDVAQWGRDRWNQEIEWIAAASEPPASNPRLPLLVKALQSRRDEAVEFLSQILRSELGPGYQRVAAVLAQRLGDPRLTAPLFERWKKATDERVRDAAFRALADLPGDQIVPGLIVAWEDRTPQSTLRGVAIEGLGRRGIEQAIECAYGSSGGAGIAVAAPEVRRAQAAHRLRALRGLSAFARSDSWQDPKLIPLFAHVLTTADGDEQRRLATDGLINYWNEQAADALDSFAKSPASPSDLAVRAAEAVAAIRAGKPRPAPSAATAPATSPAPAPARDE